MDRDRFRLPDDPDYHDPEPPRRPKEVPRKVLEVHQETAIMIRPLLEAASRHKNLREKINDSLDSLPEGSSEINQYETIIRVIAQWMGTVSHV